MFCAAMTRPQKDRTKHWHHAFTWCSMFSTCVHLPQLSSDAQSLRSWHLAATGDAASSRICWPSLLGCYMKLLEVSISAQVTLGFSQPPCSCSSVIWTGRSQTGDWTHQPNPSAPFLSRDWKQTCVYSSWHSSIFHFLERQYSVLPVDKFQDTKFLHLNCLKPTPKYAIFIWLLWEFYPEIKTDL